MAALADAAMTPDSLDRRRVEVFIAKAGLQADTLSFGGASFMIDAGTASSLVALELGSRALVERRADLALVAGVHTEADGPAPAQGVGVVVLKRLRDAERDGDRIYAVLKGVGLASAGRSRELASPSSKGHARAIRRAYRASGTDPATVGLIEGHGLGRAGGRSRRASALRPRLPAAYQWTARPGQRLFADRSRHARRRDGRSDQNGPGAAPSSPAADRRCRSSRPGRSPAAASSDFPRRGPGSTAIPRIPAAPGSMRSDLPASSAHAVLEEHPASADGITPGALLDWDTEAFPAFGRRSRLALADRVRWLRDRPLIGANGHSLKDLAFTLNAGTPAAGGTSPAGPRGRLARRAGRASGGDRASAP